METNLKKTILLGSEKVGKSQILRVLIGENFTDEYVPTVGVEFGTKLFVNFKTKLQIWDTAGQQKYSTISKSYIKGAHIVILVYDITKKDSFDNLHKYLEEIKEASMKVVLIGNKKDLEYMREVSFSEGQKLASSLGCYFYEISCKELVNGQLFTEEQMQNIFFS